MQQALLLRKEFYKSSIRLNSFYGCFIHFTYNRNSYNAFNPVNRFVKAFFGRREDTYLSKIANLLNINRSTCFFLNFLDHFALRTDNSTNKFLVNEHFLHPRSMRFYIGTCSIYTLIHRTDNMQTAL